MKENNNRNIQLINYYYKIKKDSIIHFINY